MYIEKVVNGIHYTCQVGEPLGGNRQWTEYKINRWAISRTGKKSARQTYNLESLLISVDRRGRVFQHVQYPSGRWAMKRTYGVRAYGF